jgi:hypothetical protein
MSAKLKRNEFCIVWRDNNFSTKPIYNNEFDNIFKEFLKNMKDIQQTAKYNIYTFETSEEALKLINRKKYNKIILISNVDGKNLEGKEFIDRARGIIGNNVIAFFLAYDISHFKWITEYKNALFSNNNLFYEKYFECFNESYSIKNKINELRAEMEEYYQVMFNFDDNYLEFPYFKEEGKFSDLTL